MCLLFFGMGNKAGPTSGGGDIKTPMLTLTQDVYFIINRIYIFFKIHLYFIQILPDLRRRSGASWNSTIRVF